ncbi:MAG TPA: flagellar hook-length control protein FliK [Steroidobacteraceae bacterium]|nr:flagellar hook-length control protein FliK [Steroidobacteraceae bacterium]
MIPATQTLAPSADTAGAGSSAALPAAGTEAVTTAFDAILTLETLAATVAMVDVVASSPGLECACLEGLTDDELTDSDDPDLEETEDGEAVGALAFLADLLNVAAVTRQATAGPAGGELAANDDVMSGAAKPSGETLTAGMTAAAPDESNSNDKLAAQAAQQVVLTDAGTALADAAQPTDEITSITRATDWVQGSRHASAAPERSAIATHVRDPRWADDFGTRIALMVRGGESSASLQLSPADLGPLDVSVTIRDSQASIHFGAAQAETRALIEASIPRLRDMLEAQGFQLADASVSSGSSGAHREQGAQPLHAAVESEASTPETHPSVSLNLLDVYA